MGFSGYYLEFDGVQLSNQYVCNYKCIPNRRTDKDSYVDGNGMLNRNILSHTRSGITFNTGFVTDEDLDNLRSVFSGRDNVTVKYWNPATNDYGTGTCYLPDITFELLSCENNINTYRPVELEIIEY